ncbi:hypothetical protein [Streptomyces sp. NPDC057580]|uniref:hypothetical protein n=1 Tax=Streptomyces sp. NPDC057580 TaxID=3346173 RepID=UPI0036A214EA
MEDQRWQLRQGDELIGVLTLEAIDMFWTDCHFEPAPAWTRLKPLFDASRNAWQQGGAEAGLQADEALYTLGLRLVPDGEGETITDFLLRINGDSARFRY